MPRIRSIKPEYWSDTAIVSMDFFTRLLYIALWNFADDEGRNRAIAKEISGFAFPLDDDVGNTDVERGLQTLAEKGRIILYEANGLRHYQVIAWTKHQSINRPTASRIPPPVGYVAMQEPVTEGSVSNHGAMQEPVTEGSRVGIRKQELGNRNQAAGNRQQERASEPEVCGETDSVLPALPCLPADVQAQRENAVPAPASFSKRMSYEAAYSLLHGRGVPCPDIEAAKAVLDQRGKPVTNWLKLLEIVIAEKFTRPARPAPSEPTRRMQPRPKPPPPGEPPPPDVLEKLHKAGIGKHLGLPKPKTDTASEGDGSNGRGYGNVIGRDMPATGGT